MYAQLALQGAAHCVQLQNLWPSFWQHWQRFRAAVRPASRIASCPPLCTSRPFFSLYASFLEKSDEGSLEEIEDRNPVFSSRT